MVKWRNGARKTKYKAADIIITPKEEQIIFNYQMTVRFGTFDERNSRERTTTEPTRIAKKSAAERSFKINPFIRDIEITVGEKRGQKQRERE